MVDFSKLAKTSKQEKIIDPIAIYDSLDRASDTSELRSVQKEILTKWFSNYKDKKDSIIKLHTGKGKTLIGLLILKSKINSGEGPCLYLCPDNYLVTQVCNEAKKFGIDVCTFSETDGDIPAEFLNGEKILVTNIHKLFNGRSKFGVSSRCIDVGAIILDDSHTCIETIAETFTIQIPRSATSFNDLLNIFDEDLKKQGMGTYQDIKDNKGNGYIPVPYWTWQERIADVTRYLAKEQNLDHLFFSWSLLKDFLINCECIFSPSYIEIRPYMLPIEKFGSFFNAKNRIYMSATVNNDSFFVKHLNIENDAIENPIKCDNELWSGEKMVLIPSLIEQSLNKDCIMDIFTKGLYKGTPPNFGVCILSPSYKQAEPWEKNGASIANSNSIVEKISKLKGNDFNKPVVFVNRYDGIDLPDNACRILIFDGLPYTESLSERYMEDVLNDSDLTNIKIAQKIEQGLGRNIRGEKDYGAVIITGQDLVKFIQIKKHQKYFSPQTKKQIEMGLQIADCSKDDLEEKNSVKVLCDILKQMLHRDEGWKDYYISKMNEVENIDNPKFLNILKIEHDAEFLYLQGNVDAAVKKIRELLNDNVSLSEIEKGWFLQKIARYQYSLATADSIKTQQSAHIKNNLLLKPITGISKVNLDSAHVVQPKTLKNYLTKFSDYNDLSLSIYSVLENLKFGISADKFEYAINELGLFLGFKSSRPEKQWNEGPDNLWAVSLNKYFLIECKNEAFETRSYIYKQETGQINNSCGWFARNYQNSESTNIMIIPTLMVDTGANFNYPVKIMRKHNLEKLKSNIRAFYNEFSGISHKSVSEEKIAALLSTHKLLVKDFDLYLETPKDVIIQK